MRLRLLAKSSEQYYQYHSINSNYDLDKSKLDTLIATKDKALDTFHASTAVRLDFGLPVSLQKDREQMYLLLNGDITTVFNKLTNRIRRKKNKNGDTYQFLMNWKVEYSQAKGLHIHTVWYFNHEQIPVFNLKTNIFKTIKKLWLDQTNNQGLLKIVTSSTANSTDSFKVNGSDKHYFTILSKDESFLSSLPEYHQQKNQHGTTSGFTRWVSYLAKDGENVSNSNQVATTIKKRIGTINNC